MPARSGSTLGRQGEPIPLCPANVSNRCFPSKWRKNGLQNPELRRRVTVGLNSEAHHTLKRPIHFYRKDSISDRTRLEQTDAMPLNMVVAAITLCNTAYLDGRCRRWRNAERQCPTVYLPHISPVGWEHIGITGTYTWRGSTKPFRYHGVMRD